MVGSRTAASAKSRTDRLERRSNDRVRWAVTQNWLRSAGIITSGSSMQAHRMTVLPVMSTRIFRCPASRAARARRRCEMQVVANVPITLRFISGNGLVKIHRSVGWPRRVPPARPFKMPPSRLPWLWWCHPCTRTNWGRTAWCARDRQQNARAVSHEAADWVASDRGRRPGECRKTSSSRHPPRSDAGRRAHEHVQVGIVVQRTDHRRKLYYFWTSL